MLGRPLPAGLAVWVLLASTAGASDRPRYDVAEGRTPLAARHRLDRDLAVGVRPRRGLHARVRGFTCRIRYRRSEDGEVYASRRRCARHRVTVRSSGMSEDGGGPAPAHPRQQ